jgi:hypothetical protein
MKKKLYLVKSRNYEAPNCVIPYSPVTFSCPYTHLRIVIGGTTDLLLG